VPVERGGYKPAGAGPVSSAGVELKSFRQRDPGAGAVASTLTPEEEAQKRMMAGEAHEYNVGVAADLGATEGGGRAREYAQGLENYRKTFGRGTDFEGNAMPVVAGRNAFRPDAERMAGVRKRQIAGAEHETAMAGEQAKGKVSQAVGSQAEAITATAMDVAKQRLSAARTAEQQESARTGLIEAQTAHELVTSESVKRLGLLQEEVGRLTLAGLPAQQAIGLRDAAADVAMKEYELTEMLRGKPPEEILIGIMKAAGALEKEAPVMSKTLRKAAAKRYKETVAAAGIEGVLGKDYSKVPPAERAKTAADLRAVADQIEKGQAPANPSVQTNSGILAGDPSLAGLR
jgi:hypothetical protein